MRFLRKKVLVLGGVVAVIIAFIALLGTPGSLLAMKTVDGSVSHREYAGALIALLVLGLMALGLDWQDWM